MIALQITYQNKRFVRPPPDAFLVIHAQLVQNGQCVNSGGKLVFNVDIK